MVRTSARSSSGSPSTTGTRASHVHLIVRGVRDDGENLVISRDYIKEGMRDRARDLITQELGPRTEQDIRRTLERQIDAERWTDLDRQLARDSHRTGVIDLAPHPSRQPDELHAVKVGRLRKLESLGLADQIGPGQWAVSETAEATLRELGERGDIIKRIHRGLTERGIERGAATYVLAGESLDDPVVGRLVSRGLDDELRGTAYAVVDGVDGRTHHIKLPDLDAASDGAPGSIVELRKFDDAQGRRRVALAVRSDLSIEQQITATGATWLDVSHRRERWRSAAALRRGGARGLDRRAEQSNRTGPRERQGRGISFNRNLIETHRRSVWTARREVRGMRPAADWRSAGEYVAAHIVSFRVASGRFALMTTGSASLVPWSPSLEKKLGRQCTAWRAATGAFD